MATLIEGEEVTAFEVTPDGAYFRLNFRDSEGKAGAISLPSECLNQLVLTMPCIAAEALQKRYHDSSLRLVYPLSSWSLATTGDDNPQLILTLGTPEGFQIAFAIAKREIARFTATMHHHMDTLSPSTVGLN